jgi:hypothetical protein
MVEGECRLAEDKAERIVATAPRGTDPPRRAERTEGPVWFTLRRGRGRRRRGRRGANRSHFGGRRSAKRTQFGMGAGGQGPGAGEGVGVEAMRRRGTNRRCPRPPATRRSERTERGIGRDGTSVRAPGPDSKRSERGDGDPGEALPTARGGAERTQIPNFGAENEPNFGLGAAKTNPILGGGPGSRDRGRGRGREPRRPSRRSHFAPEPQTPGPPNEPTDPFRSLRWGGRGIRRRTNTSCRCSAPDPMRMGWHALAGRATHPQPRIDSGAILRANKATSTPQRARAERTERGIGNPGQAMPSASRGAERTEARRGAYRMGAVLGVWRSSRGAGCQAGRGFATGFQGSIRGK